MKVCIEQVEGGYSVYQDTGAPAGATPPEGAPAGIDMGKDQGQTVATVDEALQAAGQLLGAGSARAEQDAAGQADALFNQGFNQARGGGL